MELVEAIVQNDVIEVMKLLEMGVDPNALYDEAELTPLHFAVQVGAIDVVALLITAGADPFKETDECLSAYEVAKKSENDEMLDLLMRISYLKLAKIYYA